MEQKLPEILLVEDDIISKDITKLFLKDICNIDYAQTGVKAIEMLKNKTYNGFLLDINLGRGTSGIDVVHEIKRLPQYEAIPIIAITAFAMVGDREEFLEHGCTHYISKPFSKEALINLVKEVFNLK